MEDKKLAKDQDFPLKHRDKGKRYLHLNDMSVWPINFRIIANLLSLLVA